jgi:predicted nucleic acid-binding protein
VTVAELCRRHSRIGLDSNVFIYLFEGEGPEADVAAELVEALAAGSATAIVSALAIAEICVGPARADLPALAERYADELASLEGTSLVPVTTDIAVEAGLLRGTHQVTLADALHLASAKAGGASAFVTNDRRLRSLQRLPVVYLSDLAAT